MKLIQSDVLLHRASLHNKVIQITCGGIPKVSTFQKKVLSVFSADMCRGARERFLVLGVSSSEIQVDASLLW